MGEYVKFTDHDSVYELVAGTSMTGSSPGNYQGTIVLETGGLDELVANDEVVDIYHQGTTLKTDGWGHSVTGILKAGDYFEVNDELKIITSDVNSDISGNADLLFEPSLRATITDNTAITTTQPKATMRLVDDRQTRQSYRQTMITTCSFNCIEAF